MTYKNGDRVADRITNTNYHRRGTVIGLDPKDNDSVIVEWDAGDRNLRYFATAYSKKPIIEIMTENDAALKETKYELNVAEVKEKIKHELDLAADALVEAKKLAAEAGLELKKLLNLSSKFEEVCNDIGLTTGDYW